MSEQSDALLDVLTDAGRAQVAAFSAAVEFWSSWAESAASYSRRMTEELGQLSKGDTTASTEIIGRMTDLNREYLRRLTELPQLAANRFNEALASASPPSDTRANTPKRPPRRARAKE
jgi:hypothetical protein